MTARIEMRCIASFFNPYVSFFNKDGIDVLERFDVVRDPIYGYIELTKEEKDIIKTTPLLRLARLNPTPGASYVYPGCSSNRLAHSLGVKHLAGLVGESLVQQQSWDTRVLKNVRLAGLLHDIGHGPFSHAFDSFLEKQNVPLNHEKIGFYVLNSQEELTRILPDEERRLEIAYIAWGKETLKDLNVKHKKIEEIQNKTPFINVLSDVIHGAPHCVDILDFLARDSYHAGVEYGQIDVQRLVMFMDVFRGKLAIENRAFEAYESMIMARFNMFRTVYWHRTSRAMDMVLLDAIRAVDRLMKTTEQKGIIDIVKNIPKSDVSEYMQLDDGYIFTKVREILSRGKIASGKSQYEAAYNLLHRKFPKLAYRRPEISLSHSIETLKSEMGFKTDEEVFEEWKKFIIKDVETSGVTLQKEKVIIDTPSLPFLPVHGGYGIASLDVVFFERINKTKRLWRIPEDSILHKMNRELLEFRVYTVGSEALRSKIKRACEERWGKLREVGREPPIRKRGTQA